MQRIQRPKRRERQRRAERVHDNPLDRVHDVQERVRELFVDRRAVFDPEGVSRSEAYSEEGGSPRRCRGLVPTFKEEEVCEWSQPGGEGDIHSRRLGSGGSGNGEPGRPGSKHVRRRKDPLDSPIRSEIAGRACMLKSIHRGMRKSRSADAVEGSPSRNGSNRSGLGGNMSSGLIATRVHCGIQRDAYGTLARCGLVMDHQHGGSRRSR